MKLHKKMMLAAATACMLLLTACTSSHNIRVRETSQESTANGTQTAPKPVPQPADTGINILNNDGTPPVSEIEKQDNTVTQTANESSGEGQSTSNSNAAQNSTDMTSSSQQSGTAQSSQESSASSEEEPVFAAPEEEEVDIPTIPQDTSSEVAADSSTTTDSSAATDSNAAVSGEFDNVDQTASGEPENVDQMVPGEFDDVDQTVPEAVQNDPWTGTFQSAEEMVVMTRVDDTHVAFYFQETGISGQAEIKDASAVYYGEDQHIIEFVPLNGQIVINVLSEEDYDESTSPLNGTYVKVS